MAEVTLKDVRKVYAGGVEAVKGVSFDVPDGHFCVMVGPSGCGKSTLMDLIAGLSPPTEGTITLDVDPATGLIAVDSCPVIRTKTFIIGQEPKKYCGPEYHKKTQPTPTPVTRSRLVNPQIK